MKTIVITGANSGIGFETAKHLALQGNRIIAASRQKEETLKQSADLDKLAKATHSSASVEFMHLDLNDLDSVRQFADVLKSKYEIIDTLICNAGIMNSPYKLTIDGYEQQFQTNFLSHFYLTHLLMDRILLSSDPRIIHVGSASSEKGLIHSLESLERICKVAEEEYVAITSYRESKLAQQICLFEFARKPEYSKIKFSLVHPGIVNTNLFYRNSGVWYKIIMLPFVYLGYLTGFFKTPKQGAQTSIFLATINDYPNGTYWHGRKKLQPNPISGDLEYAKALFEWSVRKLNILKK